MIKNSKNIKNVFFFVISSLRLSIPVLILVFVFLLSGCTALGLPGLDVADQKQDIETTSPAETQTTQQDSGQTTPEETITTETQEDTLQTEETTSTDAISDEEVTINVYYANSTGEYLIGEARTVSGVNKLVDAVSELMKDPVDATLISLMPDTTKINSVSIKDGVAKVDLSKQFVDDRFVSETVDILLIYSIVNTLTEIEEIHSVEFYIDGTKLDELGQLDIKDPVFRRSDLIKQ